MMKLGLISPPSGGLTGIWRTKPRSVVVIGAMITKPAELRLNRSSDTTKVGRTPPCSCPVIGSNDAIQISPRKGEGLLFPLLIGKILQAISQGAIPRLDLVLILGP